MNPVGELVLSGSLIIAIPIALLAGVISFASPCILPLVPGYLGFIGGFAGGDGEGATDARNRRRLLLGVALFVLGFSVVFVTFGLVFGVAGLLLKQWMDIITRIAGVIVIIMGLVFIGQFTFLQRTARPGWRVATGLAGAPFLGLVFGLGWAPCIGPTLTAVLALSLDGGSPARGALLGAVYCLGLGIPFLLVALGFGWVSGSVTWLKRNIRIVNIVGGAVLVVIGLLMVTGLWQAMVSAFGAVIGAFVTPL
ncbi:MAG: sulfite exporter TauE/SafE family protein [Cryobacterium sp.]|nr:sulfite exporter TauE/SafE family protein [Micrococcales bacterium]MBX3077884.1 sulfite exporter TauE/SafE family protein [Cryobacterium sp.]MBX3310970.1 sulfite exporter TauE/SafE family protein [Cryobacterium sp.]MCB1281352.1 sulfite exporter TauE/SafE family protein [Salinibacterium sp.]